MELLPSEADLIYGMLTQRLHLRQNDPERTTVANARATIYPFTSAGLHEEKAGTGHVIGATYRSHYWGGTYKVVGKFGEWGVTVECVTPGAGAHRTVGEQWSHSTSLDKRDTRVA